MGIFNRKSVEIDVTKNPEFDGIYNWDELNKKISDQMVRGNLNISFHTVRKYCQTNEAADRVCAELVKKKGFKISFLGKLFSNWP